MKFIRLYTFLITTFFLHFTIYIDAQSNLKTVNGELPLDNTSAVEINMKRDIDLEIVPWEGNSIKIVYRYDAGNRRDQTVKSLQDLGVDIQRSGDRGIVNVNPAKGSGSDSTLYRVIEGKTYYKADPFNDLLQAQRPGRLELLFIYIPTRKKMFLNLHFKVKVNISGDLHEADINAEGYGGCTLTAKSIEKLSFNCSYPNAKFETIEQGTISVTGGQLLIKKAGNLSIQSRYVSAKINSVKVLNMIASQNDQYTIGEVESLRGLHERGIIVISVLKKEIDVHGTGGISISDISDQAEVISIKSEADVINLPVKNLRNYAININASDGILMLTEEILRGIISDSNAKKDYTLSMFMEPGKNILVSKVGDNIGKHTLFNIICPGCTINFRKQE